MDLSVQSDLAPADIHLKVVDQTRLIAQLEGQLGIARLTQRHRQTVLNNIAQGLKHLTAVNSNAVGWAGVFRHLAISQPAEYPDQSVKSETASQHAILQILIDQPGPSRTAEQRDRCLAIGALAVMAIVFNLHSTPSQFSSHLKQLFRSSTEGWTELCAIDFLDAQALEAWIPVTSVAVVREFQSALIGLLRMGVPPVSSFLTPEPPRNVGTAHQVVEAEGSAGLADQPKKASPKKPPDDISANFDMFKLQKQRDCQADVVDGFRIPLQWLRQHPGELKQVLVLLNDQLKQYER